MNKILITKPIVERGLAAIRECGDVTVADSISAEELAEAVTKYDAIVSMLTDKFTDEIFQKAKGGPLKIVANYAVGYDNIDVKAANAASIWATNTPEVLTEATAEMAWALLFAIARKIPVGDAMVRPGTWKGWNPTQLVGGGVSHKTVGIIGAGRIGQAFGRMGAGFGIKILYHNRNANPSFEGATGAQYVPLETLMAESDFVSVHLPASPETKHMISSEMIAKMKTTAYFISTGRGNVIDEPALTLALKENRIAGAALDVYEFEPAVNADLLKLDNVVLAPHLGSATVERRMAMAERCAQNIQAATKNDPPLDALK
ncbi:MAG: D-glycerate dehydrogenase [Candidatus Lindowbacteria bacterium]|nr:D-glycerate dehydrogenase [Candidatus Lindowbacteria bacterium]